MILVQEETYTFTPDDGNPPIHIFSGRLRVWLLENAMHKVQTLVFPVEPYADFVTRCGVEADRVASLTAEEVVEPVIVGLYDETTHVLIDGAHRVAKRLLAGVNEVQGWLLPMNVWKVFTFDPHAPNILAHSFDTSRLPQRRKK